MTKAGQGEDCLRRHFRATEPSWSAGNLAHDNSAAGSLALHGMVAWAVACLFEMR